MHVVAGTIGSAQASGHGQRVLSVHRQPAASLAAPRQRRQPRQRRSLRVAAMDDELTQEELEAKVEAFMRRQAEIEGGEKTRTAEPGKVLGADEVSEEEAKRMCREIVGILRILKEQRDMTLNEVRLTVGIEDPRAREKRLMGMEDSSGISRDEMAVALMEVSEGRIPTDRIALRELCREISQWPALDEPTGVRFGRRKPIESPEVAIGGLSPAADDSAAAWWQPGKLRQPMGRDPNEQPRGLADQLPEWFGYGALYLVSIAPVLIAILAISILFFNSFR